MKIAKQEHGVIMMETILSLPIYIIMLAGLFWLGELAMTRIALANGENFALWEESNRHTAKSIPDFFSFMSSMNSSEAEVVTKVSEQSDNFSRADGVTPPWGKIITGYSVVSTRRSEWSTGADQSARAMSSGSNSSTNDILREIYPRDAATESDIPWITLFSRVNSSYRDSVYIGAKDDGSISHTIFLEKWEKVPNIPNSQGSYKDFSLYNSGSRYDIYKWWSL